MSIMTRVFRIFKADMHGVMDQLEDKELLLKQYLREMETDLQSKEAHLQHITETERRTQADHAQHRQEIDKLEQDLTLAVRKEKDEIARLLIRKQRSHLIQCEHLQHSCDSLQEEYLQLAEMIEDQRLRYETLKVKAEEFCRQNGQGSHPDIGGVFKEKDYLFSVDSEEIELELLFRKEQLQAEGGTV